MLKLDAKEFVPGNTKMFLKAGTLSRLRVMREQKIFGGSSTMQVSASVPVPMASLRTSRAP